MPELPEVETVMRGFRAAFQGQRISRVLVNRPDLRWPFPADLEQKLKGRRVLSFRRRAKYILMRVEGGWSMLLHLGMSGRLTIGPAPANATPPKHEHFVLETENGVRAGLVDPRRFGSIDLIPTEDEDRHRLLLALGVEPISGPLDSALLLQLFKGRRTPIKTALLDQKLIAGLGNIYVCEALFRCGIHPERQAHSLRKIDTNALATAIPEILEQAIASGGSSLRDYVQADGTRGGFQDLHLVYGKEGAPCPTCGPEAPIQRIVQSGRSTFFCNSCQNDARAHNQSSIRRKTKQKA